MDSSLIAVLANLGTGGVVIILIVLGYLIPKPAHARVLEESARKDEVVAKLQEALTLERQRADDATQAGGVTNQLIGGLVKLASEAREHGHAELPAGPLDLTGKDLGLSP